MVTVPCCLVLLMYLTSVTEEYRVTISSNFISDTKITRNENDDWMSWIKTERRKENDEGHDRKKRKGVRQEISFDRRQPRCLEKLKMMKKGSYGRPVQLVTMAEEGETATFACHYCGNSNTKFISMVWHHLQREKSSGRYSLVEVSPDMHDDESLNRISVGTDHTLIIKTVKRDDVGTYFCRDYSRSDWLVKRSMTSADIKRLITDKRTFRFLYHFDVLLTLERETREVSRVSGKKGMSPAKRQILRNLNLVMDTSWGKWSTCSTCGRVGERKRVGACYLRKYNVIKKSGPWYVNAVMMSYPLGVPCRSSIFQGHREVKPRPDEIEAVACEVECAEGGQVPFRITPLNGVMLTGTGKLQRFTVNATGIGVAVGSAKPISVEGIDTSIAFDQSKGEKKNKKFKSIAVDEGSTVNLTCSDVPIDWTVVWTNNTRVLDFNISDDRVIQHANNVLQISHVVPYDTATYHCLSHGEVKIKVKLTVVPSLKIDTATWLYAYFVSLTYPADFILFLVLMIIKHRHRRAGRHLNKKELREIESFSSRGSSED